MTTVYALTSIYLRETTKVFTFPVSFKVIAVCASYTVGGEKKRKRANPPFNNKINKRRQFMCVKLRKNKI